MKKVMKFISLFLILSLLVMPMTYADTDKTLPYTDEALKLLEDIGIIEPDEKGNYDLQHTLTRGEMSVVLLELSGAGSSEGEIYSNYSFNDISESIYAGSIQAAANLGIVSGFGDGTFRPDNTVKYEEAITALVNIIGYDIFAEQKGGYPSGYLNVANINRISNGIPGTVGEDITFETFLNLVYKTLHTDVLRQVVYGSVQDFEAVEGEHLLYVNFDIKTLSGIVTGNTNTLLENNIEMSEGKIKIDDTVFDAGKTNIGEYLGYSVKIYYTEADDGEMTIISYCVDDDKNNIVTVKSDDIADEDPDFSYTKFVAYKNNKKIEYNISENVDLIYNGVSYPGFTLDTYSPDTGTVTLVDNNDDRIYDVIVVTEFTNYVVDYISASENILFDMYGKTLSLSADDYDSIIIKNMWGEKLEAYEFEKWEVLSVSLSKEQNIITVVVYNDPVFGIISSIKTDEQGDLITVDGESFYIADSYAAAVKKGNSNARNLKVGDEGIFYLDMDEKVAAAKIETYDQWEYGYMINAASAKNTLSDYIQLKILTTKETEPQIFETDETVRIDGETKTGKQTLAVLRTDDTGTDTGNIIAQVIRFRLDGKGIIKEIDTYKSGKGEDAYNLTKLESMTHRYARYGGFFFNAEKTNFFINDDTIIFAVPADAENIDKDEHYRIRQKDYLINRANQYVNVDAYGVDLENDAFASVIVLKESKDDNLLGDRYGSNITLVEEVYESLDDERNLTKVIEGINYKNEKVKLYVKDIDLADGIEKGDLISYEAVDDVIYDCKPMFDASEGLSLQGKVLYESGSSQATVAADYRLMYGIMYYASPNVIKTTTNIPVTVGEKIDTSSSNGMFMVDNSVKMMYLCDMTRSDMMISEININDLQSYTYLSDPKNRVAVYTVTGDAYAIVLYKY